ncbi:MAG: WS/DGAT domain-containing protein, partial [Dermatophilaceae bacterium]
VPYAPIAQQIRTTAAMVTYAGQVTIGITADAQALPDVDRLIAAVGREIDELAAQGSHTPAQP